MPVRRRLRRDAAPAREVDAFCCHAYCEHPARTALLFRSRAVAPEEGHAPIVEAAPRPLRQAVDGQVEWDEPSFPTASRPRRSVKPAICADRAQAVVVSPWLTVRTSRPPLTPCTRPLVYEVHVTGSRGHRASRRSCGTYPASRPAVVEHLHDRVPGERSPCTFPHDAHSWNSAAQLRGEQLDRLLARTRVLVDWPARRGQVD